jgi:hypothetical protein
MRGPDKDSAAADSQREDLLRVTSNPQGGNLAKSHLGTLSRTQQEKFPTISVPLHRLPVCIMQLRFDEILKADLAKLHSEVNQMRNHEFFICSFALALVGSTAAAMNQDRVTGLGVIGILFTLFAWHLVIADSRSRVTTYLRASGHSKWEELYRQFSDEPPPVNDPLSFRRWGQRNAAVFIFVMLGLCVPVLTFREGLSACIPKGDCVPIPGWFELYMTIEAIYLLFVLCFGVARRHGEKLNLYKNHWSQLIEKKENELRQASSLPSPAPAHPSPPSTPPLDPAPTSPALPCPPRRDP